MVRCAEFLPEQRQMVEEVEDHVHAPAGTGVGDDGRPRCPPGRDDPNGHLAGGAESAPVARRSANERVRELASLGAKRQTANQSDGPFPPSGRNFGKGFPLARE